MYRAVERIQHMRELFAAEIETCEAQIKEAQEFKAAVNEAVATLPPIQQDIIGLRYRDGHNWVYIGFKVYMSESNVRRHDTLACQKLSRLIEVGRI